MGFVSDTFDALTGKGGEKASRRAAEAQSESAEQAIEFQRETRDIARGDLQPFRDFGEGRLNRLNKILKPGYTPKGFKGAANALGDQVSARAAARGKLGSGNTLNDLFKSNALLKNDLLNSEYNREFGAVNLGQSSAAGQANTAQAVGNNISSLLTQQGNAIASGHVGGANARSQGVNNLVGLGTMIALSDRRLKRNLSQVGEHKGVPVYRFQYLWSDDWFEGVMAQDVPHAAVELDNGYLAVDYGRL